ncbi:MAG: gfo/Idh/MocA family oxidoreductase, partial [Candidatus Electrothrix sp. MAN1_4]|nr:gfo/Idh/MocA family oxidoreductase [Candidatus Electrothrix sp. MAN1_4]
YLSVDFTKKEVMAIKLKKGVQGDIPLPDVSRHGFSDQDVLEMELREFIDNIRHRQKPTVSGREGRRALAVALSVISQIQENQEKFGHLMGEGRNFGFVDHP